MYIRATRLQATRSRGTAANLLYSKANKYSLATGAIALYLELRSVAT
jgi:hypothetical protein